MNEGFRSLVRSLRAFVGFWFAFLCATLCNTLIPIDTLRETFPLRHLITDAMVDLRLRFLDVALRDGKLNMLYAVWTLLASASTSFIGYFKEIFVIVTLFHFTPLLQGVEVYFTIPRWFRRLMSWLGMARVVSATAGDFADIDDCVDEDTSEPPELEDCSQMFANGSDRDMDSGEPPAAGDIRSPGGNGQRPLRLEDLNTSSRTGSLRTTGLSPALHSHSHPNPHFHSAAPTPLSPGRRAKDGKDWYVYDPVFGVIPQETRDLWQAQESDSAQRRGALLEAQAAHKRQMPPVRYSQKEHSQS